MSEVKPDTPKLPLEISNDGHELWDWAASLGQWAEKQQRKRTIRAALLEGLSTCGSCDKWMTSSCPKEKAGPHGRPVGPSCKSPKCGQFQLKAWDANRLRRLAEELASLEQEKP